MKFKTLARLFLSGVVVAGTLISTEAFSAPEDFVGMDACLKCHPIKKKKKEATLKQFSKNKHAKLEQTCESCHGPGAKHSGMKASELTKLKKAKKDTFVDRLGPKYGDACVHCHAVGGKDTVTLSGDLLVNFLQESAEMGNNLHMTYSDEPRRKVSCSMCHDAHLPTSAKKGIKRECLACHQKKFAMPVEIAAMADLGCIDCHMPLAVKHEKEGKIGNYVHGDVKSHIFGITADPDYKFNDGSGKAAKNEKGMVRLTVEQTCGACHMSGKQHDMTREEMLTMATKVHPEKKAE